MNIQKDIVNWLKNLKGWQTELAYRILTKEKIGEFDIAEIITMIKSNANFTDKVFPSFMESANENRIRLLSIESIQNIESLAPRNPLKFEDGKNLIVIYGSNGSGKSGYTKIIKKISGKPRAQNLKPNIFTAETNAGKCLVKYSFNGTEQIEKEWSVNDAPISDLAGIDVFDTNTGNSYVEEANVTTYTPKCMALFEALSYYFQIINQKLEEEKFKLAKTLPSVPNEYRTSVSAELYNNLRRNHTEANLASILLWNDADEQKILDIENRLKEKDPAKSAIEKRKQKSEIDKIIKEITDAYSLISFDSIKIIKDLENDAIDKRKIAQDSALIIAEKSELQGVGSQVWKSLWEAAKAYSFQEAYKDTVYPNIDNNARCVLCHQLLDGNAKERLSSFNNFITSQLERDATIAEKSYAEMLSKLPKAVNNNILSSKCNAANLNNEWLECLTNIWGQIDNASNSIKQKIDFSIDVKLFNNNIEILKTISTQYEKEAIQYEADATLFDRDKATKELAEFNSKKWCSQQKDHILKEIERLKQVAWFDDLISQCNTRSITIKADSISESVITEEYVKRFNDELSALSATKIKVELVKEKASKGTVTHSLKLKGINGYKPVDILSEGEHRIIALAAFLADVTGGNNANPFVFDDPISSLDQQYEEKTVERLVELSETRQVIIFTHRLSLLGQLDDKGNSKIQIIGIRNEYWGTGEIGDTPLFAKKPTSALNNIKNDKLAKAKKIYNEQGSSEYYPYGKMLCSDIRILIERIVECNFLADVVQRYRRAVTTMGKVEKLAKITKEDCDLINDFMTRYSYYEHSQPNETPVEIPEPTVIETDVDNLLLWLDEFNKRK